MVLVQQVNRGKPMVSSKVQCWRLWTQGTASLRHSHSAYSVPLADRMKLEWEECFEIFETASGNKWNRFLFITNLIETRLVVDYCVGCQGATGLKFGISFGVPLFKSIFNKQFLSTCVACVLSVCDLYPTSFWKRFAIWCPCHQNPHFCPRTQIFVSASVLLFNCPSCLAWFALPRLAFGYSARASI